MKRILLIRDPGMEWVVLIDFWVKLDRSKVRCTSVRISGVDPVRAAVSSVWEWADGFSLIERGESSILCFAVF
jgi:hypothetical protein